MSDMRNALAAACLAALVVAAPEPAYAQEFETQAPIAILHDVASGSSLIEKGADTPFAPASLVKVMTALVVFEAIAKSRISLDEEFVVSVNAWRRGGAPSGSATMFTVPGARIKVSDLLLGLLVQSGNDAAITLAEGLAGSEERFVAMMNEVGQRLGLRQTTFRNATGFSHPEQRTTARDMIRLATHVIATHPQFYQFFGQRDFTWNNRRQENRNPLLAMNIGADGMKTGQIEESGFNLIGTTVQNGQRLILVMSGARTARDRGVEARRMVEWGYRSFQWREVFAANEPVGEVRVFGGDSQSVRVTAGVPVKIPLPRTGGEMVRGQILYNGPIAAPIRKGAEIGRLRIERGTLKVADVPVFAVDDVPLGPLTSRAADAAAELSWRVIRRLLPPRAGPT